MKYGMPNTAFVNLSSPPSVPLPLCEHVIWGNGAERFSWLQFLTVH